MAKQLSEYEKGELPELTAPLKINKRQNSEDLSIRNCSDASGSSRGKKPASILQILDQQVESGGQLVFD